MALNISDTQIYAGRYHYKSVEIPNLLDEKQQTYTTEKRYIRDEIPIDTVTFSDEGLAKSKNWREYTKDNPNISHINYEEQIEEFNKQIHTVNNINTASMFNCELGEVAEQIKSDNGLGERSGSHGDFLTVMAKAYQVIYDRIEEDFADPDRETTYLRQEDGTYVEETKQDRIDALNQAYNSRTELAASAARSIAEIEKHFKGKNYSTDFLDELQNKVKESWQNAISEKNMERLRQKVSSLKDYSLDFGIGSQWSNVINSLLYRK